MPAVKQDIKIEEGATFQMVIDVSGHVGSLSGATAKMQVRASRASADVLLESVPTVNDGTKQVLVKIGPAEVTGLVWRFGEYDVEMDVGADIYRLAEGRVFVSPEVTRS